MAKLGIDKDFLLEFAKLDRPVAAKVRDVFGKFAEATHTGIHLEPIKAARDKRLHSIRIDKYWRGVVLKLDDGDFYILLTVRGHDEAYDWAARRTVAVNPATGVIELRDVTALQELTERQPESTDSAPLLVHVKDSTLTRLGVDESVLQLARTLTDTAQLEAAKPFVPQSQWDVLYGLAAGLSPDEVWAEVAALTPQSVDTTDLNAAAERTHSRIVVVDGPEELLSVFDRPLDWWRVFLHPSQQLLAEKSFSGPARVTGGPGTGKTVVALHRAFRLAERNDGRVLFTTFTSTLSAALDAGLVLLSDSPGRESNVRNRIDVVHVDKLANQIVRDEHGYLTILDEQQQSELWQELINQRGAGFTATFLGLEWRDVVLAQNIESLEQYLDSQRSGRGLALSGRQRQAVWALIEDFESALRERKLWTHESVLREAYRISARNGTKPFRHVVIDEAQDLSPMQWRLLRAIVPQGPDDMFIAGDSHQRIYNNYVSLRTLNIRISGRSSRLKINYRTTAEILAWSLGMMRGEQIDDLDDGLDTLAGCRSDVHGAPPTLRGFTTSKQELSYIGDTVQGWLDGGVAANEIGIAARTNSYADRIAEELTAANIAVQTLPNSDQAAVAVGTMHRMKGLEFRCVLAAGVSDRAVPLPKAVRSSDLDKRAYAMDLLRERSLLFVACTRAREDLVVTWNGKPSPFLDGHL
ncbi:UvrD-helicase domain-containing protein [Mycolicibacterium neworleansense]|uniref:DNA 3'-5' helicase n=1 Tax=Mycolicibacterium neworleansense TaxID=146018 RepID=A0A0H5S6V3_9MYCO|nr:UvrD-helicase domain-containing protein [Mycolicibacterium neworleansense]MCV7361590.1 DEAD/DEAH box helicase [Mycolicibacterium neworleansense]CRZ16944.1 UvrD/REP helicase [Mycolicibacterium neworleansense]